MLVVLLSLTNEILTAAIVIIAVSMLLYNLSRNWYDRIARTSGVVLLCVTVAYTVDVFLSLEPNIQSYEVALRLQWLGLAFMPSAIFHLSDALLATTGLPSRGRRRVGIRVLYGFSTVFLLLATLDDMLIRVIPLGNVASLQASTLFGTYVAYFLSATGLAFINVNRARQRCITRDTRRRMAYLQFAMLTPAFGIFPYSVLLGAGNEFSIVALILVNAANAVVILMLLFLSYPLSFFGSQIPDRVVKSELLSFFMRGPATGLLILATIAVTSQATQILGITGNQFMPFAIVSVVLMWQWTIALTLPSIEAALIYGETDSEQLHKLRQLSDRILSQDDLLQLMDALLQSTCDYLRVNSAFVAVFKSPQTEIIASIGPSRPSQSNLTEQQEQIALNVNTLKMIDGVPLINWESFWIAPLHSLRITDNKDQPVLVGIMGIQARAEDINLTDDERQQLSKFARPIEQTLDDLYLQEEIFAALEGLLPQISMTRTRAAQVEYKPGHEFIEQYSDNLPDHEHLIEQIFAALKHYWGGPGLTHSRLLDLEVVRGCMATIDNPANALRSVLQDAIELQRPEGERKTTAPEWTIYNILDMRFVKGEKVTDVARKLSISPATFHRKQRIALEAVATAIEQMERNHLTNP